MRKASAVALSLDEILRLIFEHVYAVGDSTAKPAQGVDKPIVIARQTLARCARVSQTFCSAALAVLWRNLDDLVPLFRLLGLSPVTPGYAYVIHKREERELVNVVDVSGRVERQQWARFQHFARLIRRVALVKIRGDTDLTTKRHIDSLDDSRLIVELAPSALLSAWRHNNEAPLLPNLNVITFVVHDYILFSEPIHTIISPNVPLRSLSVKYDRIHTFFPIERNFISTILRVLDEVPVTVQHLRLHGVLNAQIMRSLTRLRNLQRSELLWNDPGVLQRWQSDTGYDESLSILSALSDLTELNLAFIEAGASQRHVNMAAVPSSGFPSLQKLRLAGDSWSIQRAIPAFHTCTLTALDLQFISYAPSPDTLFALVSTVARLSFAPLLRSLRIFMFPILREGYPPLPPFLQSLQPLLNLRGLEMVGLTIIAMPLTDAEILTVAQAWPHLTELKLSWYALPSNEKNSMYRRAAEMPRNGEGPTLQSLLHFARHTPLLQTLTMERIAPLSAADLDYMHDFLVTAQPDLGRHAMHRLTFEHDIHICAEDERNARDWHATVAQFLDMMFPQAERVTVMSKPYTNISAIRKGQKQIRWLTAQAKLRVERRVG